MSAGALVILIAALIAIDERLQEEIQAILRWEKASVLGGAAAQINDGASTLLYAVQTQSVEHAPLTVFVATATVLVVWMLRT
jgi:hypothetical protein